MRKTRILLAATLTLVVMFAVALAAPRSPLPNGAVALRFDQLIPIDVQSKGVEWRGGVYHLVRFGQALFFLDDRSHLKAVLLGSINTFDDVDYLARVQLYDREGQFVGAASGTCQVARMWLGKTVTEAKTIEVDLGPYSRIADAHTFRIALSEPKVLTPDEWQKQP